MKKKLILLIIVIVTPIITISQWSTDPAQNLRVTTTGLLPEIVTDGVGGAYILYKDMPLENVHLYLQRLNKYGYRKFQGNGMLIADSSRYQQQFFNIISDDHHGAIIGFQDVIFVDENCYYNSHIQRIDSTGNKLWGENGILIDKGDEPFVKVISLCNDGTGGCYVFWGRYYNRNHKELWVHKVDKDGHIMWDSSGVMITDQFISFDSPIPCLTATDNNGGVLFEFTDSTGVKIQRINTAGCLIWTNDLTPPLLGGWIDMKEDGFGGVIIAETQRSYYEENFGWHCNIVALRIDNNGNKLWGEEYKVVTDSADDYTHKPKLGVDKACNSYIAWIDRRTANFNVYGQKLDKDGVVQWKSGGILIGDSEYIKSIHRSDIVVLDSSGIIVLWTDNRLPDGTISGQYIDALGNETWLNDVLISSRANISAFQVISDGNDGAISCWYEAYPDKGIYAQQVSINGNLGEVIAADVKNRIRNDIPQRIHLFHNYPNPFNANTVIKYQISELAFVNISIYDITGKEVIKLFNEKQQPGEYQVIWNGNKQEGGEVASGLYFVQLKVNNYVKIVKSLLIR